MGADFVECQRDSANPKQVQFALVTLAFLCIPLCASEKAKGFTPSHMLTVLLDEGVAEC